MPYPSYTSSTQPIRRRCELRHALSGRQGCGFFYQLRRPHSHRHADSGGTHRDDGLVHGSDGGVDATGHPGWASHTPRIERALRKKSTQDREHHQNSFHLLLVLAPSTTADEQVRTLNHAHPMKWRRSLVTTRRRCYIPDLGWRKRWWARRIC